MDQRFAQVDRRFEQQENRINSLEGKVDALSDRIDAVADRFGRGPAEQKSDLEMQLLRLEHRLTMRLGGLMVSTIVILAAIISLIGR